MGAKRAASPTSLVITFRDPRGPHPSRRAWLVTDLRIAPRLMQRSYDYEDARALMVDEDRWPKWSPRKLADVAPAAIDCCFAPFGPAEPPELAIR